MSLASHRLAPPPPASGFRGLARRVLVSTALVGALIVGTAGAALASAGTVSTKGLGPDAAACRAQTEPQGRAGGLPAHLLTALSHVESGRWDSGSQEKVAWPWTINAAGEGKFFPTKAAAIAEVRRLQARGVRSIDVGCMQINLMYHGDAFPDLETAFDPAANVAYAVTFLTRLKAETGSWQAAAVRYHSATPKYAAVYRAKLTTEWSGLAGAPRNSGASSGASSGGSSGGSSGASSGGLLVAAAPTTSAATLSSRRVEAAREAAAHRAALAEERAQLLAEQEAEQAAAKAFADAWRAERLAAFRRARAS